MSKTQVTDYSPGHRVEFDTANVIFDARRHLTAASPPSPLTRLSTASTPPTTPETPHEPPAPGPAADEWSEVMADARFAAMAPPQAPQGAQSGL